MNLGPFNAGGQRICFDIDIPDNQNCNDDPNLSFTVVMSNLSTDVIITIPTTTVVIDDSNEPECGKLY